MAFGENNLSIADITEEDILSGFSKCGTKGLPITSDNLNAIVKWLENDIDRSPSFEAGNDNGHTWINNALTTVKYSQVLDKFNMYDASRGEVTIPLDGIWYFEASMYLRSDEGVLNKSLSTTFISLNITDAGANGGSHRLNTVHSPNTGAFVAHPKGSLTLYLTKGTKATVSVYQDSGEDKLTSRPSGFAFFRGHLVKRGTY